MMSKLPYHDDAMLVHLRLVVLLEPGQDFFLLDLVRGLLLNRQLAWLRRRVAGRSGLNLTRGGRRQTRCLGVVGLAVGRVRHRPGALVAMVALQELLLLLLLKLKLLKLLLPYRVLVEATGRRRGHRARPPRPAEPARSPASGAVHPHQRVQRVADHPRLVHS